MRVMPLPAIEKTIGKIKTKLHFKSILQSLYIHLFVFTLIYFHLTFFRCNCDDDYSCVLTENLSDRQAYVFKCRTRSQSENMYLFPE